MDLYNERIKCVAFVSYLFWFTAFGFNFFPEHALAQSVSNLPQPGQTVSVSPKFEPAVLVGITVNPVNPLLFDFIVDRADSQLKGAELEKESQKLIKYFLAALTIPEDEVWVNLSPYEDDFVIPSVLGSTEMGRDMLAQDYLLKQISASLTHPDDELGKLFWKKVYTKAYELYGVTELPVNTFNKVWITSGDALVLQQDGSAFVAESHLKVMLEGDYISARANLENEELGTDQLDSKDVEEISEVSSSIIKEIIVPELQREVNEGENFAVVRQIYNAVILATWYKKNLRETLLGRVYVNKNKIGGIQLADEQINDLIYNQYLEAFRKGVYSLIREDYDPLTEGKLSRRYFSGGLVFDDDLVAVRRVDQRESLAELPPLARQRVEGVQNILRRTASPDSQDDDARYVRVRALGTERSESGLRLESSDDYDFSLDVARLTRDAQQRQAAIEAGDVPYTIRMNGDTLFIPNNVTIYYEGQVLDPELTGAQFMLENVRIEAPPQGSYGIYLEKGSGIFNSIIRFSEGGLQELRITGRSIIMDSEISGGIAFQGEQVRLHRVIHTPEETKTYDYAVDAAGKRAETLSAINVLEALGGETTVTVLQEQDDGSIRNVVARGTEQIESVKPKAVAVLQRRQLERVRSAHGESEQIPVVTIPTTVANLPQESPLPADASNLTKRLPKGVDKYGGIDFNPDMLDLQIKRNGKGIPLSLEQQNIEQIDIDGIYPVILEIAPATFTSFPFLLGSADREFTPELSQK